MTLLHDLQDLYYAPTPTTSGFLEDFSMSSPFHGRTVIQTPPTDLEQTALLVRKGNEDDIEGEFSASVSGIQMENLDSQEDQGGVFVRLFFPLCELHLMQTFVDSQKSKLYAATAILGTVTLSVGVAYLLMLLARHRRQVGSIQLTKRAGGVKISLPKASGSRGGHSFRPGDSMIKSNVWFDSLERFTFKSSCKANSHKKTSCLLGAWPVGTCASPVL